MGRAADPRLTVRLSGAEHAALDGAARALGVETGGLLKAAALRGLASTVAEVEAGRLRVRRRSVARTSIAVARSEQGEARVLVPPVVAAIGADAVVRAVAARRAAGLL